MTNRQPLAEDDPTRIGEYELLGRLGEGGQGIVYLGRGPDDVQVAVKLLKTKVTREDTARDRFVKELANAKRVARFCTAQVLAADISGDRPFIVSEYVEGSSLAELVRTSGPLVDGALERLAIGTATALAAIHRAGVMHRDFKPQNVLLGSDGPRVIDFGIAKALDATLTQSSGIIGTPAYMAPEQATGAEVGSPVDVFAWASTMVFAATGAPPFGQDTIHAVMGRLLYGTPRLGQLTGQVRELALAALARDPLDRPTAEQLLLSLLGHGVTSTLVASPDLLAAATNLAHTPTRPDLEPDGWRPTPSYDQRVSYPTARQQDSARITQADQAHAGQPGRPDDQISAPPAVMPSPAVMPPPGARRPRQTARVAVLVTTAAVLLAAGGIPAYMILLSPSRHPQAAALTKSSNTPASTTSPPATGTTPSPSTASPSSPSASASASASASPTRPSHTGPRMVWVPAVAGMQKQTAINELQDLGFIVNVTTEASDTNPQGTVIRRVPASAELAAGSTITLIISSGPAGVIVPDAIGQPFQQACATIERYGFKCQAPDNPTGQVTYQNPLAGSTAPKGSTVVIR